MKITDHLLGRARMNETQWSALREYIAAEVKLAVLRHERMRHANHQGWREPHPANILEPCEQRAWDDEIGVQEMQSTRMETAFRESLVSSAEVKDGT